MATLSFEKLHVYQLSEKLTDRVWVIVAGWRRLAQDTVGKQIIRSADSIGANIAEGSGRGSYKDNKRFVRTARASLYETHHWLRRAYSRSLIGDREVAVLKPLLDELRPRLNAYLRSIGTGGSPTTKDKGPRTKDQ